MNWDKAKNFLLIVLCAAFITLSIYAGYLAREMHQQSLALTAKDGEAQQANLELGLAQSELVKSRELESSMKKELSKLDKELKDLIKEHDLEIKSRDVTIAKLENKVKGTTTVVVTNETPVYVDGKCPSPRDNPITYYWISEDNRFVLDDPNIWTKDDEVFTSEQYFKITGLVFEAKDGQLQVKQTTLQEVKLVGEKWEPLASKVTLVDSQFQYTNRLIENKVPKLLDIITLRPYVSYDTALSPGVGFELVNFGRYFPSANIGIAPKFALDVSNIQEASFLKSRLGIDLIYHLMPPLIDTNLGIGVGVSSPVLNTTLLDATALNHLVFTISLHFYLTDDLSPFKD